MADVNAQLDALEQRVHQLENNVCDLQVMNSKRCIVFRGPDVRPIYGECPWQTLQRLVWTNWGINLFRYDVAVSHWLGGGKSMIAEFLQRDQGSSFDRILRQPRGFGVVRVFATLRLTSRQKRLKFLARMMARGGDIRNSYICHVSGKLQVQSSDRSWRSISDPGQLFPLMSASVLEKVKEADARRSK